MLTTLQAFRTAVSLERVVIIPNEPISLGVKKVAFVCKPAGFQGETKEAKMVFSVRAVLQLNVVVLVVKNWLAF